MKNKLILITLIAGAIAVVIVGKNGFFTKKSSIKFPIEQNDLDITYGSDSASITMYMFSDYYCSHCRNFLIYVLPKVKVNFIETGKVRFVLKLVNFSTNPYIQKAYKTAICLNKYGNFEELNNLLLLEPQTIYTNQFRELVDDYINRNSFFAECFISNNADDYLSENMKLFIKNEFKGTPTFVINNSFNTGFMNFDQINNKLQSILKKQ